MPLEIMVDTKKKKGVMKLSTLRKIDDLQTTIEEIPELSKPISILYRQIFKTSLLQWQP
jgi:hypothetical protein